MSSAIAEAVATERATKRAKADTRAHFASLSAHGLLGSGSAPPLPTPPASEPATSTLPEQGNNTDELLFAEVSFFLIVLFD
jgi:hypothetical protein